MLVRRFQQWLTGFLSRVTDPLRSRTPVQAERDAVLSGARCQGAASAAHASGNWLDDGRRLRPGTGPLGPAHADQVPLGPAAAGEASGRTPKASRPSATTAQGENSLPPPADPPTVHPPVAVPPAQPLIASVSFEAGADERDVQMRRGLASLKYLVRLGIYNEGFKGERVPEQYQRSLGMDGSPQGE
jgi:hypothetical protein